ncbi:NADH-quinone oxidoreductase subunit M [Sulfurimonas aquatica]|uniref:NADH-quinone oxidoreductase subunit M n=1 Tax=Sulfurimonas aquatica TaxID=2672570 RepID=A0A975GCK1_9BACT|nr:NADH-quinone oxidoreductase subunit M [Sulfurimonas aquatica]QSZ41393.1 NADH-quinone oxidoreductase subunit M [Sulfurimonas aquatica]
MMSSILTQIIFLPLFMAIMLGVFRASLETLKIGAILSSLGTLILVLYLGYEFDPNGGMQFVINLPWIKNSGISYYLGLDYLSLVILLLITILMPPLYLYILKEDRKGYWYNMMLLQTGVSGAVLSLDLILFYLFWETMLLPIFIMIGKYGNGMHQYNSMKILLITILGSMSMLFSILYIGYMHFETTGIWSFALVDLMKIDFNAKTSIILAAGFLLAFAIKIPLVGFHTWMAPAYGSAPTPAVVIMSSIMAKLGIYGIWRFGFSLFDTTLIYYAKIIIAQALVGLLYYAIRAITEDNLRRMFAYSSGSHLSLIALGLFLTNEYAWSGTLYFIATHALASAGIFIMIGLTYKRFKTVNIKELGGIASKAPLFTFFFAFFALSIAGLPGTGGFVAELLIIIGAFKYNIWVGVFTALTMLSAMIYIFWMLQRTLFGTPNNETDFKDLDIKELLLLFPLMVLLLVTGIAPSLFISSFEPQLLSSLEAVLSATKGLQ